MLVPNRHSRDNYRYGFQGQEKDDEIKGEGNSLNYTFRMHDPRVGRFFAIDPLFKEYPHYTPYSFSGNKVIASVELEGLEDVWVVDGDEAVKKVGPYVGTYSSEQAAKNNTSSTSFLRFTSRLPKVARPQGEIRSNNLDDQVFKFRGVNPGLAISRGVLDGAQEAPAVILPEIAIAKVVKKYKTFKQAQIAVKAAKAIDKVDNGAYHGMEFLDDGLGFIKPPLEMQASKISNVSTKVDMGKQGKHIVGHNNYKTQISNGNSPSILEADAQSLLDKFNTGKVVNSTTINDVKTRVDFGTKIGEYFNPSTGKYTPTTNGIIHNSKSGAHIVPAAPN